MEEVRQKVATFPETELLELARKTAFVLAITTFWRPGSDLAAISTKMIRLDSSSVQLTALLVKEGDSKTIRLPAFREDSRICPVRLTELYLARTEEFRKGMNTDRLFLTNCRTPRNATAQTIGHWIKKVLEDAGVDVKKFTAHSVRAVSASTALANGVQLETILKQANWASTDTFARYYRRDRLTTSRQSNPELEAVYAAQSSWLE